MRVVFILSISVFGITSGYSQLVFPVVYQPSDPNGAGEEINNPIVVCQDTLKLIGGYYPTKGTRQGTWSIAKGRVSPQVLPSKEDTVLVILSTQDTVEFRWTVGAVIAPVYVTNQKPTPPNAGENITICQNTHQLNANNPAIGKGKWIRPSNDITFSDSTSNTATVSGLPPGATTLIWQISSVCDTLQDTTVVNNQSIPKPDLGVDRNQCVDSVHLVYNGAYSGVWTKLGDPIFSDTSKYLVDSLKLGTTSYVWTVFNGSCSQSDTIEVKYAIPIKAKIVTPFAYDTIVCVQNITLKGENEGGFWRKKGETTVISSSQTLTINSLLPDSNIFYRIFNDDDCGITEDSALIIYNKVPKPQLDSVLNVCADSVSLNVPMASITGFWTKLPDPDTLGTSVIRVKNLQVGNNLFSWTETKGKCAASDTIRVNYKIPSKAFISTNNGKDTVVCSNQISLNGEGGDGYWRMNDSLTEFTNPATTFINLKSGTNVFYWTVEDGMCGNSLAAIKVINKTVPKPDAGSDRISCTTTSILIANDTIAGQWYKLPANNLISSTDTTVVGGLVLGDNKFYRKSDNGFCSVNDTINVFYKEIIEAEISVPANADTVVCKDQISLVGKGVGKWTSRDSLFTSAIISPKLKSDTNVFYWTVTDSICGKAVDSVRVVNRAIAKPSVVLDSCFIGIPTDSLLLSPKSIVSSGNTGVWSSETTSLKSNLLNNSAKFKPNSVGQYKFKFKVSNTTCSDSSTTTYRILTKAQLAKDSCILKKRGELAIVNIKNNFPANISRGEKGVWAHLDTNAINEFDPNKPDLGFRALRGVYSFVYTISDTCKTCKTCESKDTITVSVTNKANIIENNICLLADTQQVKVNPLLVNQKEMEKGVWKSSNLNLTFQNPKNDTVFTVSSLPIGKNELIWTVAHLTGCGTTSDTVRIARITMPDAGPDRCYDAGNKNLKDDIFANTLAPGELGQWNYLNNSQIIFDRYGLDANYCTVRHNDPGIYYLKWSMASNLCPLETFSDVVKLSFVTQPKLSADTFFTIPFSREHILTGAPSPLLVNKEKSKWIFPTGFSDSTKLKINEYPAGKYIFKYSISDSSKTMPCTLSDSIEVVYLTKAFIKKSRIDTCVKGVNIEFVANSTSPSEIVTWSSFTTTIQPKLGNPSIANISLLPIGKHKVYLTITSLGGRFASKDSIIVTKLNTPTVSNDKICRDTLVVLNSPFDVKNLKGHEKAYWVSNNGLLNGVGIQDTIRQLKPGNYLAGLVIKDTASFCADTAKVTITKVSKAKAASDFTTCLTDTSFALNANGYSSTERGKWTVLSVFNTDSRPKFLNDTNSKTTVYGLGNRNTRIGWTIKNKKDSTCTSTDSLRLVVITKPKASPKDTCIEFFGQTIILKGNRSTLAPYEISRWSMLDGKLLANSQNLPYTPDSAGHKNLLYTIIDFTNNYRCEVSDTTTLRLVPKAKISTQNLCIVLPNGQTKVDTLKVNVFSKVAGLSYRFNEITIAGIPDSIQTKTYNLPNKYVNKWEIALGANCVSPALDTTTVISKAISGTDTCLIGADTITLKGNQPLLLSQEIGKWSVLQGNAKFSDSTKYNSKVIFSAKGLTRLQWNIQNGGCADSNSIKVSSISKAVLQTPIPSCLKDIDSVQLHGNTISKNEKSIWQILSLTKDTILKSSLGKVKVAFGVNRFKYTIYDPLYPTCSDSVKVAVSVLKKMDVLSDGCNNYDNLDQTNILQELDTKPIVVGLTYKWVEDGTLVGDSIKEENNSSKLQYNSIGKRTLWLKSFVTGDSSCRDSVSKIVRVVSKVSFSLDTCITSASFQLTPKMYPDFKAGEYLRVSVESNPNEFTIRQPSGIINGYSKGVKKVRFTAFDQEGRCSVDWDKTFFTINYISKSSPSEDTVCKYFEEGLQVALNIPQIIDTTEKGAWLPGDDSVKVENNTAKNIQQGKNLLKWRITSEKDSKCYSDSTVNYYTLTPSGFISDTLFTCVTDTTITSLSPTTSELVDWSESLNLTLKSKTDSSISLQNLSNDIDKTVTVIRKISLGEVCPLRDTVRVLNRQLEGLNFANAFNDEIQSDPINTCLNQTFIYLFDPKKDIPTANLELFASNSPSGNLVKLTQAPDPNPKKIKFLTPQLLKGQYTFTAEAKNANCPVLKAQLNLTKSVDIGGSELPYAYNTCDQDTFQLINLNIKTPNITIDSARWIIPADAIYSVSDIRSSKPDTMNVSGLSYGNNNLQYLIYSEGCKATYNIRISNHQPSQIPQISQGDSVFKCNSETINLTGKFNYSEIVDTALFKYYWTKDNLVNLVKRDTNLVVNKMNQPLNKDVKYYFVVKNGVCEAKFDSVLVANYQKIDSISAGTNDTICATKINLEGYKKQTFAKGSWYDITNGTTIPLGEESNLNAELKTNTLNKFLWKVTNGVCEKNDTLKVLVGDIIATASVEKSMIIDCDTGDVLLKGNDPSSNGGIGFWWTKPNDTLSNINQFKYLLKSKSSRDTLQFFYTIKNDYCSTTDTTTVYYFKKPSIANAGEDQTLVKKQTVMNANQPEVGIGTWRLKQGEGAIEGINNPNTSITDLVFGENVFIWRISNGETCKPSEDEVILAFSDFDIPQAFSPNGDGKNDRFEIVGLENYSGSKLKVLNRWGREVYTSDDYQNNWDGGSLDEDTYFFILEISGVELKKGYVVIKRK